MRQPQPDTSHQVFNELQDAWAVFADVTEPDAWEVANARVTAALTLAQAVVREAKRQRSLPLQPPDFQLPWLKPKRAVTAIMSKAS
jgi:hypothetical protein